MPAAGSLGLRILVVEDNKVNQRVIEKVTEHLGYHAVLAGNGIEGLEALRKEKFDLILMDCQMPEMDGFEATRQIRAGAIPGVERIPIVALTSNVGEAAMKACTDAGMDAYLTKPFNVERLAEVVEAAVEKSKKAAA
jgi:CheY-like chemotaxis protein